MIAVLANSSRHACLAEFFQLFKTPWEVYRPGKLYDVVLCCASVDVPRNAGKLLLVYGDQETQIDRDLNLPASDGEVGQAISFRGRRIPLYGRSVHFGMAVHRFAVDQRGNDVVAFAEEGYAPVARVGYDLGFEIQTLLCAGQPTDNSMVPTLELHIDLLRRLILGCGVPLVEIPPVPDGRSFVACLTHDVDHPGIRFHGIDHTALGFIYRAVAGSVSEVLRGRRSVGHLLKNWFAAAKLPLVKLGLARDFWNSFGAYRQLENGLPSTFFVVPFRGYAGRTTTGVAPKFRATAYGAADLQSELKRLVASGCEIGLHGLDAWLDKASAQKELAEVMHWSGISNVGVRMHWLYSNQNTPVVLETAGAAYDATAGYNEAIGFRSGTTQVYKPLSTSSLLEIPLNVMDTALFRQWKLDLSYEEAESRISKVVDDVAEFGGAFTLNWHDRSIAPERLWGDFYLQILEALRKRNAWFATAGQAASWFRLRRTAEFQRLEWHAGELHAKIAVPPSGRLPGFRLRIYAPQQAPFVSCRTPGEPEYVDIALTGSMDASIRLPHVVTERSSAAMHAPALPQHMQ